MANTRLIRRGKLYSILSLNEDQLFWVLSGLIRLIREDQYKDNAKLHAMLEKFLGHYDEIVRRTWL